MAYNAEICDAYLERFDHVPLAEAELKIAQTLTRNARSVLLFAEKYEAKCVDGIKHAVYLQQKAEKDYAKYCAEKE